MKKRFVYSLAILVILSSCNSSGEKYTLKPNMKAGESYGLEYKIDFDQDVMGMQNGMQMTISYLMKIKNVTAQQDMEMDFMYDRLTMEMKSSALDFSYDSDSTYLPSNGNEEGSDMAQSMRRVYANSMGKMINKPIQVTIDAAGQVKEVKGYQELVKSIQDSIAAEGKQAANEMMNENQVKQLFQQTFGIFPKKPVAIGEEWTNQVNMTQSGMVMKYDNTYKLVEILKKENEAIIDVKGIISLGMTPDKEVMKIDISGTTKGTMVVDLNTGLIKNGKQNIDIKMEMDVNNQKVPMTMKGTALIKGKKL